MYLFSSILRCTVWFWLFNYGIMIEAENIRMDCTEYCKYCTETFDISLIKNWVRDICFVCFLEMDPIAFIFHSPCLYAIPYNDI